MNIIDGHFPVIGSFFQLINNKRKCKNDAVIIIPDTFCFKIIAAAIEIK
jgi:hypothetical protein